MGVRTAREEGSEFSKLTKLIRQVGENHDVYFRFGTVTSPPPSLKIKVEGVEREQDKEDLIIAEHLLSHKRKVTIKDGSLSGSTTTNSNHSHGYDSITWTEAELTFEDELKAGDRVIVIGYETEYGREYAVIDKAVRL